MHFGVATLTRGALGNRNGYLAVAEVAERLAVGEPADEHAVLAFVHIG